MRQLFVFVLLMLLAVAIAQQITSLPGLNFKPNFKQYSGYFLVNATSDRNLFYWFVESQNSPSTDPLLFWFQGGPGCSSLFGFFVEHGPFIISADDSTLSANPYSYNLLANVVYVESPAGVGFSYVGQSGPYTNGDNETMVEAYQFIVGFLAQYSAFANHSIIISGESYGGHYVPQLSWYMLRQSPRPNIVGMLVGNPWTDDIIDSAAVVPFLYGHSLISYATWLNVQQECGNKTLIPAPFQHRDHMSMREILRRTDWGSTACNDAMKMAYKEVGDLIDQYNIYYPCSAANSGLDCENYTKVIDYLNSPAVRTALHVKPGLPDWNVCTDVHYVESWSSVLGLYPEIMTQIHTTIYTGAVTFNVPFLGTAQWTNILGSASGVKTPWSYWKVNGQVAGYYQTWNIGIGYCTVLNSGHMVSEYQPEAGLELFRLYLSNVI